jgi:hypothetical protein
MKKLICVLFIMASIVSTAQRPWGNFSPMNYSWKYVGTAGFSAGQAGYTSLVFSLSGQPYLAYQDGVIGNATVMKFDGTNWINVGIPGFSAQWVNYISLAFNVSDQPYVAFEDGDSLNITVMKFDGTNWIKVGNGVFTAGGSFTSLAFGLSDQPFVAFGDYADSLKANVMKYDSVFVGINEFRESGLNLYPNPTSKTLTIDLMNLPYENQIEIIDLKGLRVFETKTRERKIIVDVENYSSGIYFVHVKSTFSNCTGKFCKN